MHEIGDYRWEGWSDESLATVITDLRDGGSGSLSLQAAADTLHNLAGVFTDTEDTMREQLAALGIDWNSRQASRLAKDMISTAAEFSGKAAASSTTAAHSVGTSSECYSTTKHSLPEPATLTQKPDLSVCGLAKNGFQALTGHETDYAKQAAQKQAAHDQAADALNNYTGQSRGALHSWHPLPPAPPVTVDTSIGSGQSTTAAGYPVAAAAPVIPGSGTGVPPATGAAGTRGGAGAPG
ncbi:MAG: PPE domain-containing protein, partial [Sciscionella sp.]